MHGETRSQTTAKATGFSSVSHMLHLDDPDNSAIDMNVQNTSLLPKNPTSPRKGSVVVSPRKSGKENFLDGKTDAYSNLKKASSTSDFIKGKKIKREGLKEIGNGNKVSDSVNPKVSKNITKSVVERNWRDSCALSETKSPKKRVFADVSLCPATPNKHEDESELNDGGKQQGVVISKVLKGDNARANPIVKNLHRRTKNVETKEVHANLPLPKGTVLTTVAGIEFPLGDVGHVLQFIEFCEAFGKVLNVKAVQAEAILRELRLGKKETRQRQSSLVQFHIKLLSLIREDMEEDNNVWFEDLKELISESACSLRELSSICDVKGYEHLDFSKKLKLLNFLCDEILGTTKLRSWIEDENSKFLQKEKEAREKVVAAKSKEKNLKQQLQDRIAKINRRL